MGSNVLHQIALTLVPGIGPVNGKNLVSYCGNSVNVFTLPKSRLLKIPGIGKKTVEAIANANEVFDKANEELEFLKKHNISTLFYNEKSYPQRLKQCADGPLLLYQKGEANLNPNRIIAIVGTRKASEYGKKMVNVLVEGLKEYQATIISGLAYGIDFQAHKNSVENDICNIAVLGHGLHTVYPAANKSLSNKIINNGCLLSEFISGTKPDRENFPKRNRIVAGMADATIVVESASKGGAVITAYIAHSYNRDVFAVPGKAVDANSAGCNILIKKNIAGLIESAEDLAYQLGWDVKANATSKTKQRILSIVLNDEEQLLYNLLKANETALSIDQISLKSEFTLSKTTSTLLNLELQNIVKVMPGNRYKLV